MRDGITDVFKVHCGSLDEASDGDCCVEGTRRCGRGGDAVSHGLMRVQLDTGVPVIFGVLTALTDDQALERAGLGRKGNKGHSE
jgi:hypothetical protein